MDVDSILLKIKLLMNKVDSQDYDNFEIWQLLEAYNRAQLLFVRSNLHGLNVLREGDEGSKIRIDDFNRLIKTKPINFIVLDDRVITDPIPDDYMMYKNLNVKACKKGCSGSKLMKVYLAKASNEHLLYDNPLMCPSFEWGETFVLSKGGRFEIAKKEFDIESVELVYYRYPVRIAKAGVVDVGKNVISPVDVGSEFSDDLTELIIQNTALFLSGDIQDQVNYQIRQNVQQTNN